MLDFLKAAPELIPVEDDPEVRATQEPLSRAVKELEQLEAREKRLIAVVNGTADRVAHDEFDEAQRVLAIRKGTQTGWYLPDAQAVRDNIGSLRVAYDTAVQAAKNRLVEAGTLRLKVLCGELSPVLSEAMVIAERIEDLRNQVGQGGGDIDVHPFPALLPGGLLAGQLEIARAKGLL